MASTNIQTSCSASPSGIGARFAVIPGADTPAARDDVSNLLGAALDIIFMISDASTSQSPNAMYSAMYGAGVLVEMAKSIVDSRTDAPGNAKE